MDSRDGSVDQLVIRLADRIRQLLGDGVIVAYLFGSHAAGRSHRDSDVDVGVLVRRDRYPTAAERFDVRVLLAAELLSCTAGAPVDVVVLNDVPPLLGRHIVTTGRRLVVTDPALEHAFVRDVQLRAADLEPFLRRTRKLKLEALAR